MRMKGWYYIGCKNEDLVIVKPFAIQCGPMEDDYITQWRVDDGKKNRELCILVNKK